MKNLIPLLLFIFSSFHFLSAQDLQFSISVKGNHSFAKVKNSQNVRNFDPTSSFVGFDSGSIAGKIGFEIGANVQLKLDEKIKVISGLAFQQIRFEVNGPDDFTQIVRIENGDLVNIPSDIIIIDPFNPDLTFESRSRSFKSDFQISYVKIPFLAEIDLIKDKVFFQLGFYGASLINAKSPNNISSPRFLDDPFSSFVDVPTPKEQFTSLLMGLQSGIRVELIKHLSLQVDYSRSINNLFDENNGMDVNMNNISAGLNWKFDI